MAQDNPVPTGRPAAPHPGLRRVIGLPGLVFYGLGLSVGAGIFVLLGQIAGLAGPLTPWAFLAGAAVMGVTACSYAELSVRLPRAAGEAAYAQAAFDRRWMTLAIGFSVAAANTVSAAAIVNGTRAYVTAVLPAPDWLIETLIVGAVTAVALWGVRQSILVTAATTLIEIGVLLWLVIACFAAPAERLAVAAPVDSSIGWTGFIAALLPVVFAYVGFESTVNMAEETRRPERTLPLALLLTLALVPALYILVAVAALRVLPPAELAATAAPLMTAYERASGADPMILGVLASVATINGVLAQTLMVSRLLYGMAEDGNLPAALAYVHPGWRTPVTATLLTAAATLVLALLAATGPLARATSFLLLLVFAVVNVSLLVIKRRQPTHHGLRMPHWVPVAGVVASLLLIVLEIDRWFA